MDNYKNLYNKSIYIVPISKINLFVSLIRKRQRQGIILSTVEVLLI